MIFYSLSLFSVLFLIAIYTYFILKQTSYPPINIYFSVNIIIFYLPALLYASFGIIHPSNLYSFNLNIFDYNDLFFYGLLLILIFDIVMLITYKYFKKTFSSYYLININNININNIFIVFFIFIFISVLFFDFFEIMGNNAFMNKDYIYCNDKLTFIVKIHEHLNNIVFLKNLKQLFSEFSNLKIFLFIITLLYFHINKSRFAFILLIIIILYNLCLGFLTGSRFSIILIIIFISCIYFNSLIKLKNIVFSFFTFLIVLYFMPFLGNIRALFRKSQDGDSCVTQTEKVEFILSRFNYNNITILNDSGFFNQLGSSQFFNENLKLQSIFHKPIEVLTSRLNYFDITLKSINYKINNLIENNFMYYFDNIYGLIPRFLYPNKSIITNNSDYLALKLGLLDPNKPLFAVGLRPIAEGFFYIGYYYIIISFVLGFLFFVFGKLFQSSNILIKSASLYIGVLLIKRDSLHAFFPGIIHEILIVFYLIIVAYILNIYKRKTLS